MGNIVFQQPASQRSGFLAVPCGNADNRDEGDPKAQGPASRFPRFEPSALPKADARGRNKRIREGG